MRGCILHPMLKDASRPSRKDTSNPRAMRRACKNQLDFYAIRILHEHLMLQEIGHHTLAEAQAQGKQALPMTLQVAAAERDVIKRTRARCNGAGSKIGVKLRATAFQVGDMQQWAARRVEPTAREWERRPPALFEPNGIAKERHRLLDLGGAQREVIKMLNRHARHPLDRLIETSLIDVLITAPFITPPVASSTSGCLRYASSRRSCRL